MSQEVKVKISYRKDHDNGDVWFTMLYRADNNVHYEAGNVYFHKGLPQDCVWRGGHSQLRHIATAVAKINNRKNVVDITPDEGVLV